MGNPDAVSSVEYDLDCTPYYSGKYPANKGWTHIAAVWSAGEYMKLYVNGEERKCNTSSIVKTHSFPRDSTFLGRDWTGSYFKGSLAEFMLFSGALADTTIKGLPHNHNWPLYQGAVDHRSEMDIKIKGQGHIEVEVEFNPGYMYNQTITADSIRTSFPEISTVTFTFVHDAGWHVDDVIIDGFSRGPQPNWYYNVIDEAPGTPEEGSVEVIFKQ